MKTHIILKDWHMRNTNRNIEIQTDIWEIQTENIYYHGYKDRLTNKKYRQKVKVERKKGRNGHSEGRQMKIQRHRNNYRLTDRYTLRQIEI